MVLARKAEEDQADLIKMGYGKRIKELIKVLEEDPFMDPPRYKKLTGEMKGMFSRRINIEHRLVYEVLPAEDEEFRGIVKVVRMKTHYKGIIPLFLMIASD